jgi:hypothetical protein
MNSARLPADDVVAGRLLDDLSSADDQWLWEVVWHMNTHFPDVPGSEKIALARRVVLALSGRGEITLWRGEWPIGALTPLGSHDAHRLGFENPPWFDPEGSDLHVVIRGSGSTSIHEGTVI